MDDQFINEDLPEPDKDRPVIRNKPMPDQLLDSIVSRANELGIDWAGRDEFDLETNQGKWALLAEVEIEEGKLAAQKELGGVNISTQGVARMAQRADALVEEPTLVDVAEGRHRLSDFGYLAEYTATRAPDDTEDRGGLLKDYAFNRFSFDQDDAGLTIGKRIASPFDDDGILIGADAIRVELIQDFRDEDLQKVCTYAINATLGVDPSDPPDPIDWEEMMKGGLQTALEDFRIAFGVYRVSRACTHQIVRSRQAAFHQQSMRAHYYGDRPGFRMPEPVWTNDEVSRLWLEALIASHKAYRAACEADISYQDARYILPEGTVNYILCEYSLREFINVYAYRGCSMFQWEIVHTMREMRRLLVEAHPWLEKYVLISCQKTHGAKDIKPDANLAETFDREQVAHTCTYQGWEEVEGQCDFPWARETNRTFRSERHGIRRRSERSAS